MPRGLWDKLKYKGMKERKVLHDLISVKNLRNKRDAQRTDPTKVVEFFRVARAGDLEELRTLLEDGVTVDATDEQGTDCAGGGQHAHTMSNTNMYAHTHTHTHTFIHIYTYVHTRTPSTFACTETRCTKNTHNASTPFTYTVFPFVPFP